MGDCSSQSWGVVVAVDISKAFDRDKHTTSLAKLLSYGVPDYLCVLSSIFLSEITISSGGDGLI